jgi:hypothetical protein
MSETRAPYTRRVKMSRPISSVPRRYSRDGGSKGKATLWLKPYGRSQGAKAVARPMVVMMRRPVSVV